MGLVFLGAGRRVTMKGVLSLEESLEALKAHNSLESLEGVAVGGGGGCRSYGGGESLSHPHHPNLPSLPSHTPSLFRSLLHASLVSLFRTM